MTETNAFVLNAHNMTITEISKYISESVQQDRMLSVIMNAFKNKFQHSNFQYDLIDDLVSKAQNDAEDDEELYEILLKHSDEPVINDIKDMIGHANAEYAEGKAIDDAVDNRREGW